MAVELYANGLSAGYTDGFHIRELDLSIPSGKITSLIGANGSGKSTILKALTRLIPKDQGNVYLDGKSIYQIPTKEIARKLAILPQNAQCPDALTVEELVENGRYPHRRRFGGLTAEDREVVYWAMKACGVLDFAHREVDSLSGGQRQRIGIARALAVDPKFIVCDEPVSALDVSIQAQVVNMFEDLQEKLGVTYLFIAHDLLIVRHISNRIAVMYLGKIVEIADADELNDYPQHPYTVSLLSAVPIPDPNITRQRKRIILEGDVPSPLRMPTGCAFRSRCRYATEKCAKECPKLEDRGNGHFVACWNK